MRRPRTSSLLVLVGLLALGLPGLGGAAWTGAKTLSAAGQDAVWVQSALDSNGNAVFVWQRSDGTNERIEARTRAPTGSLGPVVTVSDPGEDADQPLVAMLPHGQALFVWARADGSSAGCCSRVQARTMTSDGTLGPVTTLSPAGQSARDPVVGPDGHGNAVVVWSRSDGYTDRVQTRTRFLDGTLGSTQTFSGPGYYANTPRVAVDSRRDVVVTWVRSVGENYQIEERARSYDGKLGPIDPISDPSQNASEPDVAISPTGDAVLVWWRQDGNVCCARIEARERSAAGVLGPTQKLSAAGQNAIHPHVRVDGSGNAIISWLRFDGAGTYCCDRAQATTRGAAGVLGPVVTLSQVGQNAADPHVALDAAGNGLVIWERADGETPGCCRRVQAQTFSSAGILGPRQTVSEAGQQAEVPSATEVGGKAIVSWSRRDGSTPNCCYRAQETVGP